LRAFFFSRSGKTIKQSEGILSSAPGKEKNPLANQRVFFSNPPLSTRKFLQILI
jgi:hypothetical protein